MRSANEVQTLIAKAARGAGAPPAQAAAFGRAAVCHLRAARAEADLQAALKALPQGPVMALPLALARLIEGARDGVAHGVAHGVLTAKDALTQSYVEALPFEHSITFVDAGLEVTIYVTRPAPRTAVVRFDLSGEFVTLLNTLLAKTLVPDTAASRLAGAGAGLSDND